MSDEARRRPGRLDPGDRLATGDLRDTVGTKDTSNLRDTSDRDDMDRVDVGGIPALLADRARTAAVWTGFAAAALGFFVAVVAALAMWIPDAAATGTSGSTVRGGLLAFLAAQHGGLRIDGVHVGFLPLGMTWFALYLCRRSGRVLWTLPAVAGDVGRRRVLELSALQVAGYTVTTTSVSFYAVVGRSSASPAAVALGSAAVGLVGFGSVALTMTPVGAQQWRLLPASARGSMRAGAAASCAYLAGGAALALGSTLVRVGRFLALSRGMGRGLSGLPVAVGDTLAAPNAVLAGTSYLAGPGFAVGQHATYAPFGGHGGLVPAFPVLAGLPAGEHATLTVLALMALTVLGAGMAAGSSAARETAGRRWPVAVGAALGGGACAAITLGVLTGLAGGPLGSHRLRTVGASPPQVALAVLVEVTLVSVATVGVLRLVDHRAHHDASAGNATATAAVPSDAVPSDAVPSDAVPTGDTPSDAVSTDDVPGDDEPVETTRARTPVTGAVRMPAASRSPHDGADDDGAVVEGTDERAANAS